MLEENSLDEEKNEVRSRKYILISFYPFFYFWSILFFKLKLDKSKLDKYLSIFHLSIFNLKKGKSKK